jgi:2-dehydro-3-deoxygluconokinase
MIPTLDVITYGEAMAMFVAAETGPLAGVGQFTKRVAGADLNVAIGLARLGFKVGWMSRVGNDSFGQYVREVEKRRRQRPGNRILPQRLGGEPPVAG